MLTAVPLVAYAVVVMTCAPLILRRGWFTRVPRVGLFAWHATVLSALSAVVWASLVVSHVVWIPLVIRVLHIDVGLAHEAYFGQPGVAWLTDGALLLAVGLTARVLWVWRAQSADAGGHRARHRLVADAVGVEITEGPLRGVTVISHDQPMAFCLPGRRGGLIVMTSAALRALTPNEAQAVITHERAHLAGHHHRFTLLADAVTSAFGRWIPLTRDYSPQIRRLSEMAADDAAARIHDGTTVASALLALSGPGPVGRGALAVSGSPIAERAQRMLGPVGQPRAVAGIAAMVLAVALVALPAVIAWAPALHVAGSAHCVDRCTH